MGDTVLQRYIPSFFTSFILDSDTGCWNWIKSKDRDGYAIFTYPYGCRGYKFSYDCFVERRAEGMLIDHLCDNRACVNPTHLSSVTSKANTLRGNSIQAFNAQKTHCKRNHEFTKENTYIKKDGCRSCRTCQRMHQQYYDKNVRVR